MIDPKHLRRSLRYDGSMQPGAIDLAMSALLERAGLCTGIGSLPHVDVDAALEFSFRFGVPFLPQLPRASRSESMIEQALEGLPGLVSPESGIVQLDRAACSAGEQSFDERLRDAFARSTEPDAFAAYEPSAASSSSWMHFLRALEERGARVAKLQLGGPYTALRLLKTTDGGRARELTGLAEHLSRLVLAKVIAMVRRVRALGVQPLVFIDEPASTRRWSADEVHLLGLGEQGLRALRAEGARVGLHCCGEVDWDPVLRSGVDYVSIDTELSLAALLAAPSATAYLERGGRLALGVVPTTLPSLAGERDPAHLAENLLGTLHCAFPRAPEMVRAILRSALFTPACGLAGHSVRGAEEVLATLREFVHLLVPE